MAMHKLLTASLMFPALVGLVSGCSDSGSSSSSTVSVYVQAGQEDINHAIVRSAAITEAGWPNEDAEGRLVRSEYVTDEEGAVKAVISTGELQLFEVVGREADAVTATVATTVRCQWVGGCAAGAFAADMAQTDNLGWRSVAYDLNKNERIRVTPLTDLAAQLAFDYVYNESADAGATGVPNVPDVPDVAVGWVETGYYSAFSVEQAISQVSRVFGISNVQTTEPADLTQINEWRKADAAKAADSIRYGALLAAWAHRAENYTPLVTGVDFTHAVAADFSANKGQMMQQGGTQTLNLTALYTDAIANLQALNVTDATLQGYIAGVVSGLQADIDAFAADTLTAEVPDTLQSLFGQSEYDDFVLGIKRTKAFVGVLRNYSETFFEDGYKAEIDQYVDLLKKIGDEHAANLDLILDAYRETAELYQETYLAGGANVCASTALYPWVTSCTYSNGTMTLNSGKIIVSQAVADVNTTDADDNPTSSNAIDILIRGTYEQGTLRFVVDNVYEDDNAANDILSASGVRVYFTTPVSELADPAGNEILAYEMRWSDFSLYDTSRVGGAEEAEVTGSYRIFFRGVKDPQDSNSERRFNIDTVVLNGRISDKVGDDNEQDVDYSSLYVAATSTNAAQHYPEKEFASFNGFFTPNPVFAKGSIQNDLVSYATGEQTIGGQNVQYLDFYVPLGESQRFRFYPTVRREDTNDSDRDGDITELVSTHDLEICELNDSGSGWAVSSCQPKQRLYAERDLQLAINDLWEAGVFSRVEIPGRGVYFVTWPTNTADSNGCLTLAPLAETGMPMSGELYEPMVLGLNAVRVTGEVRLNDQPRTLLDVLLNAPDADRYKLTAALSHDYSGLTSSDVYLGTGSALDRIVLSFDTDSTFKTTGSVAVYKDGVALTLEDGTTTTLDSELTAYLQQNYNLAPLPYKYITGADGKYDLCVLENVSEVTDSTVLSDAVFTLNFRDVVYGRIRQENGIWLIRYIDGSWEML
ncbi:hypothetical protein [Thalassolituus hydrocarboniclasticus]|uniref:Lipoprotein n=1 Tax=Thalassolituus hydrocarboniclasticus TaxID=2742796 RepID=A0ABY6AA98_9GAMM|nr:hypothetical protein [Thalassolituus hydrocarboniclasticus]UXD87627.1 hypothetical protein HUF19_09345 [Thalassolituus hydrocarboniclasticus]